MNTPPNPADYAYKGRVAPSSEFKNAASEPVFLSEGEVLVKLEGPWFARFQPIEPAAQEDPYEAEARKAAENTMSRDEARRAKSPSTVIEGAGDTPTEDPPTHDSHESHESHPSQDTTPPTE